VQGRQHPQNSLVIATLANYNRIDMIVLVLLAVAFSGTHGAQNPATRATPYVSTEAEFREALEDPAVILVYLTSNITLAQAAPQRTISRSVLVSGPPDGSSRLAVREPSAEPAGHHWLALESQPAGCWSCIYVLLLEDL
jgi:hypothetical protein